MSWPEAFASAAPVIAVFLFFSLVVWTDRR